MDNSSKTKKCIFIIVYFGNFNSYFELFLKSCETNEQYSWLLVTDNNVNYHYPSNFRILKMNILDFSKLVSQKFGENIVVNKPYKMCDYKPMYGYLFENEIKEYKYWGHCDCDILFGNLDKILSPLLEENYDKLFASGHLTIYKNTFENNRIFKSNVLKKDLYREVLHTNSICVFDEDCPNKTGNYNNIHSIFIKLNKKIFVKDLSFNTKPSSAKFINVPYDDKVRNFREKEYKKARYYWSKGDLFSCDLQNNLKEYLYMHFQMRNMRMKKFNRSNDLYEILPDRFVSINYRYKIRNFLRSAFIGFPYLFYFDYYMKKIKNKIKKINT